MKNYSDEPLSPQLRKTWENFPKKILTSEKMNKRFRKQLTLDGFKGSPGTRLTEAVKTALHSLEPLETVLPAGVYFLRGPLVLPKEISLRGEGVASLVLSSRFPEGEPVFRCADARGIQIRRIMINNAYRNSIAELKTRPDTEAEILFAECSMERTKGGIRVIAGDGMPNLKNRTAITVANSTFRCSQVLDSNAAFNTIDCVWVTSDFELFRKGSFVNRGNLYIRGMLGVPSLDNGVKYYYRKKTVRTGAVNDPRWIDNYGNLFIDRCRFGGEAKGMPVAVNYNPRARILARESWPSSYGGNPGKRTLFYLETLPETIILEDMLGWPEYYSMTQWSAGKPFPGILFTSFCIPVRGDDGQIEPKAPGVE